KEKVFVQMEDSYLNQEVTLYLQDGNSGTLIKKFHTGTNAIHQNCSIASLQINRELWLKKMKEKWNEKPYLDLKATVSNAQNKQVTRVLVSNHRGYIFIQTDQPMYNPTQKVQFRIFTLDHMFRPQEEMVQISIFVSKKLTFLLHILVLPSFDVNIEMEQRYILLDDERLNFTISDTGFKIKETFDQAWSFLLYVLQVLSRGIIIKTGSLRIGASVKHNLKITADMVPSFRLIAYYHGTNNKIIADSVWVDVRDECEIKVEHKGEPKPGQTSVLEVDLHGQSAKVALLAVDKAFYALKANNKLTDRQVFSTMESYDLGCTFGGEDNSSLVFVDAGLSFVSQSGPHHRKGKTNNLKPDMQDCCTHAFSPLPMRRTCQERATRVQLIKANQTCADVFLKCCKAAEKLRQKQMQEDVQGGLGRTATSADIENILYLSNLFYMIKTSSRYPLALPDSITKWEIQVVTISPTTGFCVVKPHEVKAFQETFVSLRLPYSVKKYEQLSVSPVIYNYGKEPLQLAVHMEQTEGLCSPASATKASYVTIDVEPQSSHFVSFSAVPMVTGPIPIKIRLYDIENNQGIDAVEKSLNVQVSGKKCYPRIIFCIRQSSKILYIDGTLPDETVPESILSSTGDGFGSSQARNLLSPEKVASLIALPKGCLEQTMKRLVPTALALRYLDLTDQWLELLPGARDEALANIERGMSNIRMLQASFVFLRVCPLFLFLNKLLITAYSRILRATTYLQSQLTQQSHTYVMALTAYCLSVCLPQEADRLSAWKNLQSRAIKENENDVDAITIETTAYALLTAVEVADYEWADQIACWLASKENYFGGYRSTQVIIRSSLKLCLIVISTFPVEIVENYDYYNYYDDTEEKKGQEAPSVTEHSDTLTSGKRLENNINTDNTVTYTVCVRLVRIKYTTEITGEHQMNHFFSPFQLKQPPEQYITHYELSFGRVLIYFNEECFSFDVVQSVPIGLLQPAPAVFYDYYEPRRKCTVFYSAPKRSKMISTLCSEDVCQCAESRPYLKTLHTSSSIRKFKKRISLWAKMAPLKIQMESKYNEVYQCNDKCKLTESHCPLCLYRMQYLLESNTWVEKRPLKDDCKKSAHRQGCIEFNAFIEEFKTDGCRQ
uniref:Complement C4B (Chido/Rodgers blood group) n=1 Tax=Kryptolebias marmoratus TaxID=37003 RepID=A0A3Q3GFQ5_KRYMA